MALSTGAQEDIRASPTDDFIADVRNRYRVEREIDTVLTRKLVRRKAGGFQAVSLDTLIEGTRKLIEARLGYAVELRDAGWLSGGASKLQMLFNLAWRGADGAGEPIVTKMVLRMEPAASVTESSRKREFEVLAAVADILPVPVVYWVDGDAEFLPYPAMICGFVSGAAKPSHDPGKVTGLGQNYGPNLRAKIAPQFIDLLARLHRLDVTDAPVMASFDRPVPGSSESVLRQVSAARRIWEEDRIEDEPVMAVIHKWLIANAPPVDHVSIVHGDYRSGNFLFDEASGQITAWLDWEGSVLGDRHQDLTYAALPLFQHESEDGASVLASGMMTPEELYEAYAAASGWPVDPARIAYYGVYNRYLVCVLLLAAAARAAQSRGTHQDVLLNHVSAMGYSTLSELTAFFRKVSA
ncbi:MAG: phosphotransferase family protein [Blastomonas fulva]|uniref:phosphotransferase family protein n=1 Tax=Blastomonas fulva TaxID=1550728 RepID=UPI0040344639